MIQFLTMKKIQLLLLSLLLALPFNGYAQLTLYGDVNGDLEVNIADINTVIDIIMDGIAYTAAADVNNDGEINIADINTVIDIILGCGYDGENEGGIVEPTEMESVLSQLTADEENAPITTYSYADSIEYDCMAQEVIRLFALNDSDELDVSYNSRALRSESNDELAQDAILNNGKNIFDSSLTIEQLDWNSGLWGKTRYGGFETYYNTHVKNGKRCLLVVFYYKGGFPNAKTAYLKLGQVNSGKILGQVRIGTGKEYAFIDVCVDDYLNSHGCVNFFPLMITNLSQARNYLNPILVKTKPIIADDWRYQFFGYEFGTINGVSVYYNNNNTNMGNGKFQCVELCKRYVKKLNSNIDRSLSSTWGNANQWPSRRANDDVDPNEYIVYKNNGSTRVREGDLIVWQSGNYGHIGVVIKTTESYISVAHQNGGIGRNALPIGSTLKIVDGIIKDIKPGTNSSPIFATPKEISHIIRINSSAEEIVSYSRSMTASTTNLKFGKKEVGTSRTRKFTITNHGYSPLTISSMTFAKGEAFKINIPSCTIGYGQTQELEVTFTPKDAGDCEDRLIIRSDAEDNPIWCIRLFGQGVEPSYVDLGLPSGTLWATRNVGADSPEEYGDYFAWGETEPKGTYEWSTYKWCNGSSTTLTKYCTNSSEGYNGFVDDKTELEPEDDAAYVNWGKKWRMPSLEQILELKNSCSWQWTQRNGVDGYLVTGPNGNTIFLPAADGYDYLVSAIGSYWTRELCTWLPESDFAFELSFKSNGAGWGGRYRCVGISVRAVRVP